MRRGRGIVGLVPVLAVATACSLTAVERGEPVAPSTVATTAPAPTTTTTVPVPADVQDLITTTTMTERGRRVFLNARPAIEPAAEFAANCGGSTRTDSSGQPRTHTQGCYTAGRIHLLAPDRAEARELLYVVAAHELLHAVYASLGGLERSRIDAEVEAARAAIPRVEERLKAYEAGPTLANEIHSILGSEYDGLPASLEAHYSQFFSNRAAVVAARQRTLGAREDEIRRLRADVDDLGARIDALRATQEDLRVAGEVRAYNANVGVINGLIGRYNSQVDALNAQIDAYNRVLGG